MSYVAYYVLYYVVHVCVQNVFLTVMPVDTNVVLMDVVDTVATVKAPMRFVIETSNVVSTKFEFISLIQHIT